MPIQAFLFPLPETRFFQVGEYIYKFKIRSGSKISGKEEMLDSEFVNEELENAIRAVLMNLDNLHPFTTQYFNIFPYKSKWEGVSKLKFSKGDEKLFAFPFLITLYVEANELAVNHANKWIPSNRESRLDSPQLPASCGQGANEPKRRRTEEPQEGPLSSDPHCCKAEAHLRLQDSPCLYEGEEKMVCGHKVYDEESSHATSPEFPEREKSGVLARLASIASFPFSMLFKRS